jgi:hypothetical protein
LAERQPPDPRLFFSVAVVSRQRNDQDPLFDVIQFRSQCQVCSSGFDPRVLEPAHQSTSKLVAATRYELLHGTSPDEAWSRLESVGIMDEMVDTIVGRAQQ